MATALRAANGRSLSQAEHARHLLRRLAFTATPENEAALAKMDAGAAVSALVSAARNAPEPAPPMSVRQPWTNTALRVAGMTSKEYQNKRDAQSAGNQRDIEELRLWWLREIVTGPAPLRENMVVFFQSTLGSSTGSADMPQAVHGSNALIRRHALGSIPALLEALVTDPAMMLQIGMDEHIPSKTDNKLSERPAKLMFDRWTVGENAYQQADVLNLTRALTGWLLVAPQGMEPKAAVDPEAFRSARRTGLVPTFVKASFDDSQKTVLGKTENFDARSAMRFLARHPATARRYSRRLIEYFGVVDPDRQLETRLVETYASTDGSIEALLQTMATSDPFWSDESRWAQIKSPVHLVAGAVRQLGMTNPPLNEMNRWLVAAGQKLFDTPNFGDGGWPGQQAWLTPPDHLAVRYQLGLVLAGRMPRLGIGGPGGTELPAGRINVNPSLANASVGALIARLDPAPGIDTKAIESQTARVTGDARASESVRHILAAPEYQLA